MFQQWIRNFHTDTQKNPQSDQFWVERLTAVLLIEIARADASIAQDEIASIKQAIQVYSPSIRPEEVDEIIVGATADAETSISFHDQVREINRSFNREQKLGLIEQMWRVAYADGDLDKYEEYTIRKLADLLYVEHQEYIRAKLRVIES